MEKRQIETLMLRTRVKRDIALEKLLTAIANEEMFKGVAPDEIVTVIIATLTPDEETRLDMIAYLESEIAKAKK